MPARANGLAQAGPQGKGAKCHGAERKRGVDGDGWRERHDDPGVFDVAVGGTVAEAMSVEQCDATKCMQVAPALQKHVQAAKIVR